MIMSMGESITRAFKRMTSLVLVNSLYILIFKDICPLQAMLGILVKGVLTLSI